MENERMDASQREANGAETDAAGEKPVVTPVDDPLAADTFDPGRLRLSQNFAETLGVTKALLTVPVRKPTRQEFVRVHPHESYRLPVAVIEITIERELFLVEPTLCPELPGEVIPKLLCTTINRQGTVSLWPIRLPGEDGRIDEWNRSALTAANLAMTRWTRVAANRSLGAYDVFHATGDLPEPDWPEVPFSKLLEVAFRDRFINEVNHPVLRQLRGEL